MSLEERLAHIKSIPRSKKLMREMMMQSPDSEISSSSSVASRKRKREQSGDPRSGMTSPASFRTDTPTGEEGTPLSKKARFEAAEGLIQAIPEDVLEGQRRKLKSGYKLYHLANHDAVKAEMADGEDRSDRAVEKHLSKRWELLSALERRFYQDQASKLSKSEEVEEPPAKKARAAKKEAEDLAAAESEDDDNASVVSAASTVKSAKSSASAKSEIINDVIGVFRKEHCCVVCEEVKSVKNPGDPVLKCRGACQRAFHPKCLAGEEKVEKPEVWKCKECSTGK